MIAMTTSNSIKVNALQPSLPGLTTCAGRQRAVITLAPVFSDMRLRLTIVGNRGICPYTNTSSSSLQQKGLILRFRGCNAGVLRRVDEKEKTIDRRQQ